MENELRQQKPSIPDNWLHDSKPDWTRYFKKLVYLGKEAESWSECTNDEKEEWEREHPQPEPETPEPETPEQEGEQQ